MSLAAPALSFLSMLLVVLFHQKDFLGAFRKTVFLIIPFVLGGSFFLEGVYAIIAICAVESFISLDRFIQKKKKREKRAENETFGLLLYVLPLLCFLGKKFSISPELGSYLILAFFFLRLMNWPLRLPFGNNLNEKTHSHFVHFWCNLCLLKVCSVHILDAHYTYFLFGGILNSISGFSAGAILFFIAALLPSQMDPLLLAGPLGLLCFPGQKWSWLSFPVFTFVVMSETSSIDSHISQVILGALFFSFLFLEVFSEKSEEKGRNIWEALSLFLIALSVGIALNIGFDKFLVQEKRFLWIVGSGFVAFFSFNQLVKYFPGRLNSAAFDWSSVPINALDFKEKPTASQSKAPKDPKVPRSNSELIKPSEMGSFGQYLMWIFVLVFVLLISGAALGEITR